MRRLRLKYNLITRWRDDKMADDDEDVVFEVNNVVEIVSFFISVFQLYTSL
jgi:hypothetical protein